MSDRSRKYAVPTLQIKTFPDKFRSVYASVPFKFIVDGKPLYIHADLVSLHSKPLDRMMNGHMAEAQKGFATLQDVDECTFGRFIEWAYKGFYTAAEFTTVVGEDLDAAGSCNEDKHVVDISVQRTSDPIQEDEDQIFVAQGTNLFGYTQENDSWGPWEANRSKKSKSKKKNICPDSPTPRSAREALMQSFISRRPVERKEAILIPPPRPNQSPAEVYHDVFLSHAQLYVFAEKYDIQPLKMLALDELHATLANFTLYPERTGDIIDLLQYVYANTNPREPREGVEDMRTLMTEYVGFEMDVLLENYEFRGLITENGGDLLADFITMVGRRIS